MDNPEIREAAAIVQQGEREAAVPLGTIIASPLPPLAFAEAIGDPSKFDPEVSQWAPADGETNIRNTDYFKLLQKHDASTSTTIPDLRGLFLRGLNYSFSDAVRSDEFADPYDLDGERRAAIAHQNDMLQSHGHSVASDSLSIRDFNRVSNSLHAAPNEQNRDWGGLIQTGNHGRTAYVDAASNAVGLPRDIEADDVRHGAETRPKNAGVFYYIKINRIRRD